MDTAENQLLQFDPTETQRLSAATTATRLELQQAHDALIKAYGLIHSGAGPGPCAEEIAKIGEAIEHNNAAASAQSRYLNEISAAVFGRIRERNARAISGLDAGGRPAQSNEGKE